MLQITNQLNRTTRRRGSLPPPARAAGILSCLLLFLTLVVPAEAQRSRGSRMFPFFRKKEETKPAPPAQPPAAQPVRRAVPVDPAPPGPPPPLSNNPMPVVKPVIAKPEVVADPARLPSGPQSNAREDQLEYANMLYSYKSYDLAIRQYLQYLADHPDHPTAEQAWYRLGESYLIQSEISKAEECYRNQLRRFPKGDYTPAAAYRLASLSYNKEDYKTAANNFLIAEARSKEREIKLSAAFYRARSLQALDRTAEAAKAYESLTTITDEDNPYREASLLYLARIAADARRDDEALERFTALAEEATTPAIRAEALFKVGLLNSERGDYEVAGRQLQAALDVRGEDNWKPLAYYALINNHYDAKAYDKVVQAYKNDIRDLPPESRSSLLLMVGNAYRRLEKFTDAIEIYNIVEKYFADTPEGQESGYRKLLCFHDFQDPNLPGYIDFFVEKQSAIDPSLVYIDMALMLKGEALFAAGDYAGAADAYGRIREANIAEELRPSRLYKWGWALSESGNAARAVEILTEFILLDPSDPKVASALAQRAASYKALQDINAAMNDLRKITEKFPQSDAAEFAHQQSALIYGQHRKMPEMVASFEALLKNFPQTNGAAEACYWIGYGNFELKEFEKALEPLDQARELDAGNYHERASLRIILSHYYLQDSKKLLAEVKFFLNTKPETEIPAQVLSWLGIQLFDEERFADAEKYLSMASTPDEPLQTRADIWKHLGKARIETGDYADAVTALDNYLESLVKPSSRAKALLDKSIAQTGLKDYPDAANTAIEALALEKQGRVNALIRMQMGDIAMAQDKFEDAAREYIVISQIFLDPDITPRAMHKAALALEKSGDAEKAAQLKTELREKFPEFEE